MMDKIIDKREIAKRFLKKVLNIEPNIAELKDLDITYNQKAVLLQLMLARENATQLCMSDLSQLIDITKSATSQAVAKLERMGMIKRSWAKGDRRRIVVNLTPKGLVALEKMHENIIEFIVEKLHKMEEEELSFFVRLMDKCLE